QLAGLEPRLDELLWKARADGASCRCREDAERAFAPVRNALSELVGFMAGQSQHPILGSVGAYEVAFWRLHDAVAGLLPRPASVPNAGEAPAQARSQGRSEVAA